MSTLPVSVQGLRAGYGGDDILAGIDFEVQAGEIFTIIGPNGSGKSSLIKVLAGIVPARKGSIALFGRDVTPLKAPQRIAAGIAYVPQEFNVFRNMTIAENLQISTEFIGLRGASARHEQARVLQMFPDVAGRLGVQAGALSGGQRQMLAFACALLSAPEVLLLDEPSAGLSPRLVGEIFEKVKEVNRQGTTVVLVEQNVAAAMPISRRVLVLVNGKIRLLSTPAELQSKEDLGQLFLGEG